MVCSIVVVKIIAINSNVFFGILIYFYYGILCSNFFNEVDLYGLIKNCLLDTLLSEKVGCFILGIV